MSKPSKEVWFLVVPRTSMLNVAGPWEVFGHANDILGREAYRLKAFGPSTPGIQTRFGLFLTGLDPLPTRFSTAPDIVIVAGASPADPVPVDHAPLVPWLRKHRPKLKTVVSICTGAFTLASAGYLDGRRATTHWMYLDALRKRFPKVKAVDAGVYVRDGKVWTSAGLTAGIDLSLALIEEDHGHSLAMRVAKRMVLFLRRTGNQAQFSSALLTQERAPTPLSMLAGLVHENMDSPLSVEQIAMKLGMSLRTLSRWCRKHFDQSPAEVIRKLRLAEARRLLEETSLPLKEVATQTGLGDQSTLWRAFTNDLGVTPAEYRQRFAS